jgi:hypothetical protein
MSKNQFWYGYLEAGAKSTAVVLDHKLETGNTATVYLFNLARNEILEYRRDIVEPKLRPVAAEERDLLGRLKDGYRKARRTFAEPAARAPAAAAAAPARRRQTPDAETSYESLVAADAGAEADPEMGAGWDDEDD